MEENSKKEKKTVTILEVELKHKVKGLEEGVISTGRWPLPPFERLHFQPEELNEDKFIHINQESGCDEKNQ